MYQYSFLHAYACLDCSKNNESPVWGLWTEFSYFILLEVCLEIIERREEKSERGTE